MAHLFALARCSSIVAAACFSLAVGCSDSDPETGSGGGPGLASGSSSGLGDGAGAAGMTDIEIDPQLGLGGMGEVVSGGPMGPYMLPAGFVAADFGGYLLLDEIIEGVDVEIPEGSGEGCGNEIIGVVRDFRRGDLPEGHPDFETYGGNGELGIVEFELGSDRKPVHASGDHQFTTTTEDFDQWYRNVAGVNRAYLASFSFEPNDGILTFQSTAFFPLDDQGFGNQEQDHNFGFTTEIHTEFKYFGGETFSFTGDDDLWVFINDRLAIDLGGLHPPQSLEISLDEQAALLGIEVGETYALDLFHAERHSGLSNFRVDTNLAFTNCNIVLEPIAVK